MSNKKQRSETAATFAFHCQNANLAGEEDAAVAAAAESAEEQDSFLLLTFYGL